MQKTILFFPAKTAITSFYLRVIEPLLKADSLNNCKLPALGVISIKRGASMLRQKVISSD